MLGRRGLGGLLGMLGVVGSSPPPPEPPGGWRVIENIAVGAPKDDGLEGAWKAFHGQRADRQFERRVRYTARRIAAGSSDIPPDPDVAACRSWRPWFKAAVMSKRMRKERQDTMTWSNRIRQGLGLPLADDDDDDW